MAMRNRGRSYVTIFFERPLNKFILNNQKAISFLLVILSFLLGCFQQKTPQKTYAELIQGDWAEAPTSDKFQMRFLTCAHFGDSLFSGFWQEGYYIPYAIENRELILYSDSINEADRDVIHILKLNNDTLSLATAKHEKDWPDTITMYREHRKNNITPVEISFFSCCLWPCQYMRLDSSGYLSFFGDYFKKWDVGARGKISRSAYNELIEMTRRLQIDSLKPYYYLATTDQTTCGIAIRCSDGKTIYTSAYGRGPDPIELTMLFHKLGWLFQVANLKKDSSITYQGFESDSTMRKLREISYPKF